MVPKSNQQTRSEDKRSKEAEKIQPTAGGPEKTPPKKSPEADVEQLKSELERVSQEAKENYDRFLRASAELENYRKRSAREMDDLRKYATQALLKDLLPVADNLDLAIKSAAETNHNEKSLLDGIDLTRKELLKVFDRYHVKPIEALGSAFDPNYHEAVMREESKEHPENTVVTELQKGYLIHDRLLRPSMVVVSAPKANSTDADDESPQPEK
jgi:molecular chaperone GrpE